MDVGRQRHSKEGGRALEDPLGNGITVARRLSDGLSSEPRLIFHQRSEHSLLTTPYGPDRLVADPGA